MKNNHTTGTWFVIPNEHEPKTKIFSSDHDLMIGESFGHDNTEAEANAKLFAASKELLDALRFLLSSYRADFQTITGAPLNNTRAVEIAVNAIKKATI